jgi:hypothetical protein
MRGRGPRRRSAAGVLEHPRMGPVPAEVRRLGRASTARNLSDYGFALPRKLLNRSRGSAAHQCGKALPYRVNCSITLAAPPPSNAVKLCRLALPSKRSTVSAASPPSNAVRFCQALPYRKPRRGYICLEISEA